MQQQGIAPAGLIADASVINVEAFAAGNAAGICADDNTQRPGDVRSPAASTRTSPTSTTKPDKLVSTGRLTVPIMHIWNHGDQNTCGSPPVTCPLRDGSTIDPRLHRLHPRATAACDRGARDRRVALATCRSA